MWRVSKDGENFIEIDEDFDDETGTDLSLEAAKAKGYTPYAQVTKDGKEPIDIEFSEDSLKAAYDKGYKDVEAYNFTKDVRGNKADSYIRGNLAGLSQGLLDEFGGGLEAAGSLVGLRGVGSSNLLDIRLETDAEDADASLGDIYRGARDKRRREEKAAHDDNPKSFLVGNVLGGVTSGLVLPGASTLKGSAVLGGAMGLGGSDADLTTGELENYHQAALDTVLGAGAGVAGYGVAKALPKAGKAILNTPATVRAIKKEGAGNILKGYVGTGLKGFKEGAKASAENAPDIGGIKLAFGLAGGAKGSWRSLKEFALTKSSLKAVADEARTFLEKQVTTAELETISSQARTILKDRVKVKSLPELQKFKEVGAGKKLSEFSDDEAIIAALLSDGENPVKRFISERAATLQPGQINADEYYNLLKAGSASRSEARDFVARDAAKELKPVIEEVQDLFKAARSERFKELQKIAMSNFEDTPKVLDDVAEALRDSQALKSIPGSVKGVLEDVQGVLADGTGTKLQKLTPGAWDTVSRGERFHRLQQSRQLLDQQMDWAKREGLGQAENLLRSVRQNIDEVLKTSPDKVEADALYRASKEVEGKFFSATEFKTPGGGIDVDEGKISRLLGATDQAQRFQAAVQDLKEFAGRPDLSPKFKKAATALIGDLEEKLAVASRKAQLSALRQAQGPSSPALERLQAAASGGKRSPISEAVQAPAGAMHAADEFNKVIFRRLGVGFNELPPDQKVQAVRFWVWGRANPNPSVEAEKKAFDAIFGGAK